MRLCFNVMLLLAMLFAIGALPASAEVLKVDFGKTGQGVMLDFFGFSRDGGIGNDDHNLAAEQCSSLLGTSGSVNVTVSTNGGKLLGFRNREDNLSDLIEDHVMAGNGDELYLTFGNLEAGQYTITTYHHENSTIIDHNDSDMCKINIFLDDEEDPINEVPISQSYGASEATTVTFNFFVNGTDPIKITFAEISPYGLQEAHLNGFELASVPEPKAIILLVSGIACLAACGRWRQKRLGS